MIPLCEHYDTPNEKYTSYVCVCVLCAPNKGGCFNDKYRNMYDKYYVFCCVLCVPSKNGANILPGCMNGNNGRGFLADLRRINRQKSGKFSERVVERMV